MDGDADLKPVVFHVALHRRNKPSKQRAAYLRQGDGQYIVGIRGERDPIYHDKITAIKRLVDDGSITTARAANEHLAAMVEL